MAQASTIFLTAANAANALVTNIRAVADACSQTQASLLSVVDLMDLPLVCSLFQTLKDLMDHFAVHSSPHVVMHQLTSLKRRAAAAIELTIRVNNMFEKMREAASAASEEAKNRSSGPTAVGAIETPQAANSSLRSKLKAAVLITTPAVIMGVIAAVLAGCQQRQAAIAVVSAGAGAYAVVGAVFAIRLLRRRLQSNADSESHTTAITSVVRCQPCVSAGLEFGEAANWSVVLDHLVACQSAASTMHSCLSELSDTLEKFRLRASAPSFASTIDPIVGISMMDCIGWTNSHAPQLAEACLEAIAQMRLLEGEIKVLERACIADDSTGDHSRPLQQPSLL